MTKQAIDQWRAPKLIGVTVYGSDNQKIGAIKDVLIGHDGTARTIVIGVGGFLGMGTKDVALPFKDVQWKTEARSIPSPEPPSSSDIDQPDYGNRRNLEASGDVRQSGRRGSVPRVSG